MFEVFKRMISPEVKQKIPQDQICSLEGCDKLADRIITYANEPDKYTCYDHLLAVCGDGKVTNVLYIK